VGELTVGRVERFLRGDYMLTLDERRFEVAEQPRDDEPRNRVYSPGERPGLG
jgi:hypothetical protein